MFYLSRCFHAKGFLDGRSGRASAGIHLLLVLAANTCQRAQIVQMISEGETDGVWKQCEDTALSTGNGTPYVHSCCFFRKGLPSKLVSCEILPKPGFPFLRLTHISGEGCSDLNVVVGVK